MPCLNSLKRVRSIVDGGGERQNPQSHTHTKPPKPHVPSATVPIKLHTAILRVNIDDEYVGVRLDVRPRAWMRRTSCEVPMSDEEALIVRAHALVKNGPRGRLDLPSQDHFRPVKP